MVAALRAPFGRPRGFPEQPFEKGRPRCFGAVLSADMALHIRFVDMLLAAKSGFAASPTCRRSQQLLTIIVGGCLFNHRFDLGNAAVDVFLLAGPSFAQRVDHSVKLDTGVFRDRRAAGQDGNVLQHGFAPITEAGHLDRRDLEATPGSHRAPK
jgi:hypothetical protein